ncbi:MAG: acyl-CoA reductase-like NAD-dependent aldehyde dehydrogenase [Myxococcota bacterium]|jgi:acyl-CoA reductase-like NAD-dependent aldehyde dehydrogenase
MSDTTKLLKVDSPFDGEIVAEVALSGPDAIANIVAQAQEAQRANAALTLDQRIALCERWCVAFEARADAVARDISRMMGKPLGQARGEITGTLERARTMMALAPEALADDVLPEKAGFIRKIAKEPIGVTVIVAAWNYPLLIAVNGVIPSVLAGNSVILKHSGRTPLCGEHFAACFVEAGAPQNLVQAIHCSHAVTAELVKHSGVDYVAFTGSVGGGQAVHGAAGGSLINVTTELGGKDPAWVRADADLAFTIPNLVDGAMYNAGQSCCGIERVYVHDSIYEQVVQGIVEETRKLTLGDPMVDGTGMGPLAQPGAADFLAAQVDDARSKGARILLGGSKTQIDGKGRFFEPTVIADATHDMDVMMEESFGPIIAIARASDDEEALRLMNDSPYGLTASIWTRDTDAAMALAPRIETGTVFMNRCDCLDPMLAWTGVKQTGRGVSLSRHGFGPLIRLKSYHLRLRD